MKTWLITGCSSGLGRNMAEVLLEKGEQVAVTARHPEVVSKLKEKFPDRALLLTLDVRNKSDVEVEYAMPESGYYSASKAALESMSDALRKEAEPLGIQVMVVEPGAFRTDFSGRSLTQSDTEIEDYAQTAGKRRVGVEKVHGTQPGNLRKAAQAIFEIVQSGEIPFRLVLGSDAVKLVEDSLKLQMTELEERRGISSQTSFEEINI